MHCGADVRQDPCRGEGFEGVLSLGGPSKPGNALFTELQDSPSSFSDTVTRFAWALSYPGLTTGQESESGQHRRLLAAGPLRVRPHTEHGFAWGAGGATTVPEESGSGGLRAGSVVPAHTSHRGKTE